MCVTQGGEHGAKVKDSHAQVTHTKYHGHSYDTLDYAVKCMVIVWLVRTRKLNHRCFSHFTLPPPQPPTHLLLLGVVCLCSNAQLALALLLHPLPPHPTQGLAQCLPATGIGIAGAILKWPEIATLLLWIRQQSGAL